MSENRLYSDQGKRLYLSSSERKAFHDAAKEQRRDVRTFCHMLHITGCRISEALELTPGSVDLSQQVIVFRTLKKREKIHYRSVPVPTDFIDQLNMVHSIRQEQKRQSAERLWNWTRTHAWRLVKGVMIDAGIDTALPHATAKGLRHAFGIHAIASEVPVTELKKLMGHAKLETTEIYVNATGAEQRQLVARMW
jgi:integrase/recombinase XerD